MFLGKIILVKRNGSKIIILRRISNNNLNKRAILTFSSKVLKINLVKVGIIDRLYSSHSTKCWNKIKAYLIYLIKVRANKCNNLRNLIYNNKIMILIIIAIVIV